MKFNELIERMKEESFNGELFFRNGVVVEATFETYDPYIIGNKLPPKELKSLSLVPGAECGTKAIVKNLKIYDELIHKEEIKQKKNRKDFDFATKEKLNNEMLKLL